MSNNRYLEIDSTYRNRNEWPLAGEFQIPIAQSGSHNRENAVDPVALSTPIVSWTCTNLNKLTAPTLVGTFPIAIATPITVATDPTTVIIQCAVGTIQQEYNYYTGLIIEIAAGAGLIYRRITGFEYL